MAGLTDCGTMSEHLDAYVARGEPLTAAQQAHLRDCETCQAHLLLLEALQGALLEDTPAAPPPPALREVILAAARPTAAGPTRRAPRRRWWPAALSAAAALTGALTFTGLLQSGSTASVLPDPAVVVSSGPDLLVASNDRLGTLTLLRAGQVRGSVTVGGAATPWFTEGLRLGGRVFLADAANDRVLELRVWPLQVLRQYAVPGGVAGLSADGSRVYFKSVRGVVGVLGGAQVTLAHEAEQALADVMDGVLLFGGQLFVTHHLSGEVCALDPDTLAVQRRLPLGGMPVALIPYEGDLLVLDVTGRLLRVSVTGEVRQRWAVPGHPDKFSVSGGAALLSDRAGTVTRVPLRGGAVTQMPLKHPMDVLAMPGGAFAVAEGRRGLRVLDSDLNTTVHVGQQGQALAARP
ncbi:hypothetical protein [Deinococcus soli (ex Cha et al. 2016)]|uniref:hypothetical protein n=1 Tax=Deinococcus soli (ex Cha et al. 2016) TaxID=1309411 RepID=UPI00166F4423|nr:hypothetical protein [Deinococcus soli (ex Cha et al. 2016)]GGB60362.1 hypothetical protein GCM10008019_15380 [Deinococcus soli (ex Cha et al. 2016)]